MAISQAPITCQKCFQPLPRSMYNTGAFQQCPTCQAQARVDVFPALFRAQTESGTGERIITEGTAACFYHPKKKAVVPCASCGRFLCALCDVEFNDKHLCPQCIEKGGEQQKAANLENKRTKREDIAVTLAILPLLLFYVTLITAPVALFYSIRHWKTPMGPVRGGKWKLVVAMFFSIAEITGWIIFFAVLIAG